MDYRWIRFFHIASAILFVGVHGASMFVLYAIRRERDRARIESLLSFSSKTVIAMYVSLAAIIGTGFWLGWRVRFFYRQPWFWWSLALLVVTSVVMWIVAKPFTRRLRAACEIRPSLVPRVSDEELRTIVRSGRTHLITLIGTGGLGAILYLMIFRPAL